MDEISKRYLDKLDQTSKDANRILIYYLGLGLLIGFSTISTHGPSDIHIPFLNIAVEKWNALELLLLIQSALCYQYIILMLYSLRLEEKISGNDFNNSLLSSPSVFTFYRMNLKKISYKKYLTIIFCVILIIPAIFWAQVGIEQMCEKHKFVESWGIFLAIYFLFLFLSIRAIKITFGKLK